MDEILYQKSYQEYKAELDGELQRTAEGFVRIGYLLKVARDTNILAESGYKSVAEFAEAEYSLDKTQVSRFISINDKFSEGGYSDHLCEAYQGYGYAKLTIMLQLPDAINEELTPAYSKAEIQAVKDEIDEEEKVTDIERYMESKNEHEDDMESLDEVTSLLYKTILQLGEDDPELYVAISLRKKQDLNKVLPEIMAPAGDKMYSVRVRGIGRMMLSISELSDTVKLINSRTGEKETYNWTDVAAGWIYAGVLGSATEDQSPEQCWEQRYERKYPIVAPVQQPVTPVPQPEAKKTAPKKESKVVKSQKDWVSAYKKGQQIMVLANDHIGELVEKTEDNGKWKVKFATYEAVLSESQFTEYVEPEVVQTQLNDTYPDVPEVQETEPSQEPDQEDKEVPEESENENLPGQMNVADYGAEPKEIKAEDVEVLPADAMNPPSMQLDRMQQALMDTMEDLRKHILAKEWNMAEMDAEMLMEDIRRAKHMA